MESRASASFIFYKNCGRSFGPGWWFVVRWTSIPAKSCLENEFKGKERYFSRVYHKDDDNDVYTKNIVYYFIELSKFAAQMETLDMGDERNLILYMFTNVVYLQEEDVNSLTPMQMRFYEECQISNFTNMEKQDYVKSLMEYPSVHDMV